MNIPNGALKDPRTEEAKAKDYGHIAGSVPITWKELDLTKVNLTQKRWQNGSYSCVFQTGASMLEALLGEACSATPYFWRPNYPAGGSCFYDMANIFYNRFTTTESLSTSQNQSEVQMNVLKPLTTFLGITGYKVVPPNDIDQVAEAIEAYKQCGVCYVSNDQEWTSTPKYLAGATTFGHAITALAYGTVNGVKTLVCRDSAVPDGITYITEDFHTHRNTSALYFLGAKDVSIPQDTQQMTILKQLINLYQLLIAKLKK